jgi:hypothetical protein
MYRFFSAREAYDGNGNKNENEDVKFKVRIMMSRWNGRAKKRGPRFKDEATGIFVWYKAGFDIACA